MPSKTAWSRSNEYGLLTNQQPIIIYGNDVCEDLECESNAKVAVLITDIEVV